MAATMVEMTPEEQTAIANWKAPELEVGMQVNWYPEASRSNAPTPCYVHSIDGNGRVIFMTECYAKTAKGSVRHVNDPYLRHNEFWRTQHGGWDYTDTYKKHLEWKQGIEKRLADLEDAASKPVKVVKS